MTELESKKDRLVVFDGLVFCYPFLCFCCGIQIDVEQFAYGRACGLCDCGECGHSVWMQPPVTTSVLRIFDGARTTVTTDQILYRRNMLNALPGISSNILKTLERRIAMSQRDA